MQPLVVAEVKLHLFDISMQRHTQARACACAVSGHALTRADDAKQQKRGAHSLFYGCCLARCLSQCAASSPPKDVGVQISKRRPGRSPPAPGGRVRRRESRRFGVFGRGRARGRARERGRVGRRRGSREGERTCTRCARWVAPRARAGPTPTTASSAFAFLGIRLNRSKKRTF